MPPEILIAHSTITDGNMSFRFGPANTVVQNCERFVGKHDISADRYIAMRCDHGTTIQTVTHADYKQHFGAQSQAAMLEAEVLVTQEAGVALMLLTADCLPVSFYDPVTQTIALAHMSRHTIAQLLPTTVINYLQTEHGVDPKNLLVHIGPHAMTDSYHFPLPLEEIAPANQPFIIEKDGRAHLDLVAANNYQLITAGVQPQNISDDQTDTITHPDYFSHYAETKLHQPEKRGRLATIVLLR